MLQVQFIKDNQKKVLEGLAKRNFANANTIIDAVLKADEKRRVYYPYHKHHIITNIDFAGGCTWYSKESRTSKMARQYW